MLRTHSPGWQSLIAAALAVLRYVTNNRGG
jgi:hypothetical protein